MEHNVYTQWMGDMQFNSLIGDHTLVMDAPERAGGHDAGPIPKPLLLTALSGCTGMDVMALLRKKNILLYSFQINVEGQLTKRHPLQYERIHIRYAIEGDRENQASILEAITTSQESLCGVSAMLKKAALLSWSVDFNNEIIFSNAVPLQEIQD